MKEDKVIFTKEIIQDKYIQGDSKNWANWMSELSYRTCKLCEEKHGTIVSISVLKNKKLIQAHPRCKCIYVPMRTIQVGTATYMGFDGPDVDLFYSGDLPDYYITPEEAELLGWSQKKGNFSVIKGMVLGGNVYHNINNKLPNSPGRIWYEADINFDGYKRNRDRILFSNDGHIFITYDHYHTFFELVGTAIE